MNAKEFYQQQLKDPRWQKKRLAILERDKWTCQLCDKTEKTLTVHHRLYESNKAPWEYEDALLVTLCEQCHKEELEYRRDIEKELVDTLRKHFFYDQIGFLTDVFYNVASDQLSNDFLQAACLVLTNRDIMSNALEQVRQSDNWIDKLECNKR